MPEYTSESIKVLSSIDHVKLRRGMYIGDSSTDARQLLSEIIDNAIDEVQAGFSDELIIYVDTKENRYTVRDFGRGIPHGKKKLATGEEKEVLEVLLTVANSGGKFDNTSYHHSCFTGDTRVKLTDGRDITFEDLSREFAEGKDNYCYTVDAEGNISIEKIVFSGVTRSTTELVRVTLDSGEQIHCTADHRFMTRDGLFVNAEDLESGMSLMPGRFGHTTDCFVAYDAIWDNKLDKYVLCHHLADEYNVRNNRYTPEELLKTNRHHKDVNRLNNNPDNIVRLLRSEHSTFHSNEYFNELRADKERWKAFCDQRSKSAKQRINRMTAEEKETWLNKSLLSPESRKKAARAGSATLTRYNQSDRGRETSRRMGLTAGRQNFLNYVNSAEGRAQHSEILTRLNKNGQQLLAQRGTVLQTMNALLDAGLGITKDTYNHNKLWSAVEWEKALKLFNSFDEMIEAAITYQNTVTLQEIQARNKLHYESAKANNSRTRELAKRGAILKSVKRILSAGRDVDPQAYKELKTRNAVNWETAISMFESTENLITCAKNYNHQVLCVEHISLDTPANVYDLTVSGSNHTFLLSSGVFVHNCGLNGLGVTITNALSKEIIITSYRNGKYVKATAHSSIDVDLEYGESAEPNGTNVTFIPDEQYFAKKHIDIKFIEDRCKVASALGFRARLFVDGTEVKTDASIYDLMTEETSGINDYAKIEPFHVISLANEQMKVALKYTSDTSDRYFGYTNLLCNYLGGTHVQELSKTIIQTWKEFIEKHKTIKPNVELRPNDYLVGLRAVCAVFISKPEFSSQTKEKLVVNKKYFEELMSLFKNRFSRYLEDNIVLAQQLIKRFEEYRIAQNALLSRKEISSLIKINTDNSDNIRRRSVVSKLVECTSKKRKDTELFIVEGDSARGPFLFTRNIETQAVLPLRGKILNVTNKSVKDAVKNNEICDLANAMGCGIGGSCDASKSRYDRVIIAADADIDGAQISCLVLSVFINMFPDMVKEGRVYIAMPPLYSWGDSPKNFGWCNKIEDVPKGVQFTRFKGLGEMSDSQLKYFLVDPETRNTMQVQYPSDVDAFNRILGTSEGKRELLTNLGVIVKEDN